MLNIPQLFKQHNITPRGVIHIGAHKGEEIPMYISMGFKHILLLEADPDTYATFLAPQVITKSTPEQKIMSVQAAICDHDGNATFYRTSNSASNSLMPLKDHLQVYPTITQAEHIKVPCRKLDSLLQELDLNPQMFNYLHMDIQGGEMNALLGATETLQYIDAITSEVNMREMYEGCTLLPQMEEWLDGGGRRYERKADVLGGDGWGDAFYVRRPFVQMSCIGKLGRFGNACWQYMFGVTKAALTSADFRADWRGGGVFDGARINPLPCLPGVHLDYEDTHLVERSKHLWGRDNPILGMNYEDLAGFYQFHTSFYAPHKGTIRDIFRLKDRNTIPYPLAVAHMRWGDDYGNMPQQVPFFRTPIDQARKWLEYRQQDWFMRGGMGEVTPCIVSDGGDPVGLSFGFPYMGGRDLAYDFDMMVHANYLLVSNSSLSMFAALLNRNFEGDGWRGHCFRPVPKIGPGGLVEAVTIEEFDPWNAEVLLGK